MKRNLLLLCFIFLHRILLAQNDRDSYNKGNVCFEAADYKCSLTEYSKAIELNNHNEDYFYKRGQTLVKLQKPQKAYEDFCNGIKINSFSSKIYLERGKLLAMAAQTDEALSDFLMAINYAKVDSIKRNAYKQRALLKHTTFNYEGAYEDYLIAYKMDTNDLDNMIKMSTAICY